jgi:SAM-dependent methyltransferase
MDVRGTLKAITLELRRELEGRYDSQGSWQPGDLERRLAAIGVRRDRAPVPVDELSHLAPEDREARRVIDAFLQSRAEAGQGREAAIAGFVRDAAYTWANRLVALRCMEARSLIDEVILQKDAYGGRSLQHNRLAKRQPERCAGEDEGLFATLFDEFARRAEELPLLFDPRAPEVALRPSVAALKRCVALLSGTLAAKGQEKATDEVFTAPDALGWTYQYWNTEEKDRVFEKVRTKKGSKIEGAEIVPATCIYTEPYMVRFLVQNSLGAIWMGMHPASRLAETWKYFVRGADRAAVSKKPVCEITFLDPACGSGHFLIEAFDLFYAMYLEEGALTEPADICAAILERNLYGIDIDERAVQIAALALVMKAKEKAPEFVPRRVNLVATNIRLPAGKEHLEAFLRKHPEDAPLKPALLAIFDGLAHSDEIGSLLQIEEPVDRELRHLRDQQLGRERKAGAGDLFGPRKDEDWSAWKRGAIERLREHFNAEARDSDLAAAFFGEAASKGLSLVDLLSRRYDVVAANPPYMGSKNMGPVVKKFVERHFAPGKRDLYAAFILRCLELASDGGRVAMVTQQSWMFLRSFADLRALDKDQVGKASRAFRGVLRETTIEALAHLGEHAFADASAAGAFVALFVLAKAEPSPDHRLTAFRLVGPKSPEEKDALFCDAARALAQTRSHPVVSRPLQERFLSIPQAPLCYWLRERFFELLAGRTLGDVADVCQGLATADDARFVRFVWEVPADQWAEPVRKRRWVPFEKGGGYGKWFGHHFWAVDWEHDGGRIKATPGPRVQNEHHYFKEGWTYSYMARGSVGLRKHDMSVIAHKSPGIFGQGMGLGLLCNCRVASRIARSVSATIQLPEGCVARVPIAEPISGGVGALESACIALKRHLVAFDLTERSFGGIAVRGASLAEAWRDHANEAEAVAAVLHALEGLSEREVFAAYDIAGEDLQAVLDETGTPAGWFPLLAGYDRVPPLPDGVHVSDHLLAPLGHEPRRTLALDELADLKRRLRALYQAGPGGAVPEENDALGEEDDNGEEEDAAALGARIPIPTETFLEELAQRLEVHPISVYWLLRELREKDGVVSKPELVRFVEDYLSIMVLRVLGHQWPREFERHDPLPAWADKDGIIPLNEGTSEPALLARVRARLAEDFGADRVGSVEREFSEITGRPLAAWLASEFFKRHITQFRKRPIAWQLASTPVVGNGKRRGRSASQGAPAFACLVHYRRLDADLLPKLRTQYIGHLRTSLQTELAALEKMPKRSADQDARRLELEGKLEELKAFDARIEQVIVEGFASPELDKIAAKEPLDKWTSRDGRARAPDTRDAFLAQERRYDPNLNDGVRVNIAPLQRAGLLAADVLAAKDVEKAIADRAEWRADERRWCREGKLPQPGWWPPRTDRPRGA